MRIFLRAALALYWIRRTAASGCVCGYTTPDGALFTEALESDFLHVQDIARDTNSAWVPQAYNVTPANANGPRGKSCQVSNIIPNPVSGGKNEWNAPGVHAQDPGLQLWSRSQLVTVPSPQNDQNLVPMSELVSARTDILYGTFRIALKTTSVSGTCGAFFFYFNDSTEIDLEFLSREQSSTSSSSSSSSSNHTLHLVIQSPSSAHRGYATGPNVASPTLPFAPSEDYNELRFDWSPDRVDFYANGQLLHTMRENVPSLPGALHLSHWSNGNPGWSGGPPERDAVMTVSYVKAYFNSSDVGRAVSWETGCQRARGVGGEVCQVEDQKVPPSPLGAEGNVTGKTTFLTGQGGSGEGGGDQGPKKGGHGRNLSSADFWWTSLVVLVVVVLGTVI